VDSFELPHPASSTPQMNAPMAFLTTLIVVAPRILSTHIAPRRPNRTRDMGRRLASGGDNPE
jgi:hypothetical protein